MHAGAQRSGVSGLRGVPWNIGDEFNVVTVSFDDRETPELAAAKKESYVEVYGLPGMESGWHFLTGQQQSILRLANAVGFQFRYDPKNDLFAHPELHHDPDAGRQSSPLFPRAWRDQTFARDLRLGLVEASQHKIGTPVVDRIVLSCFHYDPETGKYTMTALNLVRAAGVLTVVDVGFGVIVVGVAARVAQQAEPRCFRPARRGEALSPTSSPARRGG